MTYYSKKLQHPKWQQKRLEVLKRDKFKCRHCNDKETTLHVHHISYSAGKEPWQYDLSNFVTYCKFCHLLEEYSKHHEDNFIGSVKKLIFENGDALMIAVYWDKVIRYFRAKEDCSEIELLMTLEQTHHMACHKFYLHSVKHLYGR